MAPPEQRSRGGVPSFVFAVFCGIGEWPPTPPFHLQDDEEVPCEKNHSVDSFSVSVHHGGEVVADHPGPVPRTEWLLGGPPAADPERGPMRCHSIFL